LVEPDPDDIDTARPPSDRDELAPPRILIVDDEPNMRRMLERVLKPAGFTTVVAGDGQEAIGAITGSSFDVILADIHMPNMTGIELLKVVRSYDLDVAVILMTGDPQTKTAIQAVELGALRYLCKPPFEPAEVVRAVQRGAHLHRLARVKRQAMAMLGQNGGAAGDLAGLSAGFDRAMENLAVVVQPIVRRVEAARAGS
jgi:DNA-binding NtrC family response regulator